jgi:CheY-like chemotaxis protein
MRGRDILIIDDDDDLRELLAELLRSREFVVRLARHGAEALAQLRSGPAPDLIVLDYMMPVMDGPGFLSARREFPELAAIPVFLLTAMGDAARDPSVASATRCFRKPLPFADLVGAVNQAHGDGAEPTRG